MNDTGKRILVTLFAFLFAMTLIILGVSVNTLNALKTDLDHTEAMLSESNAQVASLLTQVNCLQASNSDLQEALLSANEVIELSDHSLITLLGTYQSTAFTLQECGKSSSHPSYGISASGIDLKGKDITSYRYIGVDPDVMPYNTQYLVVFPDPYSYLTGIYTAADTGSNYHGKNIDVFFGEDNVDEALQYGCRTVEVYQWNP